ncbi:TPA: GNAT family N-acetyltransferase [Pseudomonas aeruginosa]|uniref:GNAT family N-acetyltransferase n=1 Tax=Pseudomonas aeruginosa TaxID=287 RepID=UPI001232AFDA|nr:GNAT family N-acetyltransferase [Pseudomonas aeruginosa]EJB8398840.1 GNAT family N-acetyltransferase [Pseudomonas aeruginosa]KAA5597547.1 GNAT family N-acetyltransferase [Pseudomonas aeruginosa]MBG4243940.1 GNAT family N-acetyltransferase [Pseudomonas aeruginosa]MCO2041447.1 GNAT family N-acetyltransferase [Pseudomonas aeruginosa]NTT42714.1 GNAT family N-acetyltransferase [Pseudomonas aeruginosa]
MISLRPMRESEFSGYLDYFVPAYASEISSSHRLSYSESLVQAKLEIADDLPDGINTASDLPDGINTARQSLLCLYDPADGPEEVIGYLWYEEDLSLHLAFINDFHILPVHQGKGLAKQALESLERDLKLRGFQQIKLRVAGDNERAKHVYEGSGFCVTGINMSKPLV